MDEKSNVFHELHTVGSGHWVNCNYHVILTFDDINTKCQHLSVRSGGHMDYVTPRVTLNDITAGTGTFD